MREKFTEIGLALCLCLITLPAQGQKLERAVLAFGSTGPNLTPFWLAREAGLYRQYGLDVDVVFFRGSTIAINALATKDAHFGAFGASSSVLAKLGGKRFASGDRFHSPTQSADAERKSSGLHG